MESDICTAIVHHIINKRVGRGTFPKLLFLKQGFWFPKQSWTFPQLCDTKFLVVALEAKCLVVALEGGGAE